MAQLLSDDILNTSELSIDRVMNHTLSDWVKKQQYIDMNGSSSVPICPDYITAHCYKGQLCPLRHSRGDKDNFVCKHWLRNLCKKSELCEFLHEFDLTRMPPCFLAGTHVLTSSGYKLIECVTMCDKLYTHTGQYKSIQHIHVTDKHTSIVKLRPSHHPHYIQSTPEHPLLVMRETVDQNISTDNHNIHSQQSIDLLHNAGVGWIAADQVQLGDYVGIHINNKSIIPSFAADVPCSTSSTWSIDSEEEFWFMGYFVGAGWVLHNVNVAHEYRIIFDIDEAQEAMVAPRLRRVISINKVDKSKIQSCYKWEICNYKWWYVLNQFGQGAANKYIPEFIQNAPLQLVQAFVDGYQHTGGYNFASDVQQKYTYTTISYNLSYGLQRLYLKLGKFTATHYQVQSTTSVIDGRTVNQSNTYNIQVNSNKSPRNSLLVKIEYGYAWFKIRDKVTIEPQQHTVYNFAVADDNTFTANNITVHNCHFYYTLGTCVNDDCPFLHINSQQYSAIDCPSYTAQGFCEKGQNCIYKHKQRIFCPDYMSGFCQNGPDCIYGHPKYIKSIVQSPNINYDIQQAADRAWNTNRYYTNKNNDINNNNTNTTNKTDLSNIICHRCSESGHYANQCTNANTINNDISVNIRPMEQVTCFKCGEKGHYANACPNPKNNQHNAKFQHRGKHI